MERFALVVLALAGCGTGQAILAFEENGVPTPATAYYSIAVQPLTSNEGMNDLAAGAYLVVTLADASYTCMGAPPTASVDSLSFFFHTAEPRSSTSMVAGRSGPILGGTSGGFGAVTLDSIDGYAQQNVDVTVRGSVHFFIGDFSVDGPFDAPHCAALDFVIPG